METKINIMDLAIDMISQDTFVAKISEYLSTDDMNTVFLLNTKMLEEATKQDMYKELLEKADMLLPGEDTLLTFHNVDVLEVGGMVVNYKCLNQMLEEIQGQNHPMYLIGDNEHQLKTFMKYCEKTYPETKISGAYSVDLKLNPEIIINEINGMDADILMVIMESPLQEYWIMENSGKINTKLCIGIGPVVSEVVKEKKEVPTFFKKLHLEKLYIFFYNTRKISKAKRKRIFRKQVAHYKNKKGE